MKSFLALSFCVLALFTAPSIAQSLSCPSSNSTTYTVNNQNFLIECGIDHQGGDLQSNTTSTFQACIALCASEPACVDVSYSGVGCYQKSAVGKAVYNGVWGARLIGSASTSASKASASIASTKSTSSISSASTPITSSTTVVSHTSTSSTTITAATSSSTSPSCPSSNSTAITSGADSFLVECFVDRAGGDLSMVYTASLGACITTCANTSGCQDVSWVPGSPGPCYMKSTIQAAQANSGVWGARLLSAGFASSTASSSSTTLPTSSTTLTTSSKKLTSSTSATPTTISSSGCGKSLSLPGQTAGGNSVSVNFTQSDGTARSYLIHIPATYSPTSKTPLLFSFHGASSTGANQEGLTGLSQSNYNPNAIVIYPNGINGYWEGAPYSTAGVDDIAFTKELLANLSTSYCLDPNRIYASGFSNGGGFVGTLACDPIASNLFAAFGANSGAFYPGVGVDVTNCNPYNVTLTCNPGRLHQPFLEVHGNADGQISYTGGPHDNECLPDIPYYITAWAEREGFGSANTTTDLGGGNFEYQFGSLDGYPGVVTHYEVNGLGHSWWGNSSAIMMSFFGEWVLSAE